MSVGDTVFIENKLRKGLETRFGEEKYTVIDKRGKTVTLEGNRGQRYKRSTTQVKKVPDQEPQLQGTATGASENLVPHQGEMEMNKEAQPVPQDQGIAEPDQQNDRPVRSARPSKFFN